LDAGPELRSVEELASLVVAAPEGRPVYLRDVAEVRDGVAEAESYTRIGFGQSATDSKKVGATADAKPGEERQAVTVAVSKRKAPTPWRWPSTPSRPWKACTAS
uniref:hypothetical protein n=1 Tax=Methylogaea oryzae TaxID=1295382 RepID=UPI00278BD64A